MGLLARFMALLGRGKSRSYPLVVVGAEFDSYQFYQDVSRYCSRCKVLFFIDEEPWNHRTYIGTAQLRYPAEMLALIKRHAIAGVICTRVKDYEAIQQQWGKPLQSAGCPLVLWTPESGATPQSEFEARLLQSLHHSCE